MAKHDILVTVGANISDFSRKMANVSQTLNKVGNNLTNMGRNLSNIGTQLTNKITKPAVAAATAIGGITLAKGFQRLIGIDTARAKLEALGHSAENVELIMGNALDAVRGTAYGLDEAATAAASAVAAGIKPGKELHKYLTLVGDAAAIAGTDFNEMASIFNKVQTAQRAYTGDLNMLADRGIPIYQWLAEEAGTSAEAIRDMASRGEVSAEMFRQAIDKNIGGAAKTIGEKSFAAALRNIGADIARIGANFLDAGGQAGGFFSTVKPMLTDFRAYLQSLEPRAAELGKKFGEFFIRTVERLKEFKAWWDGLSPTMQSFIKRAAAIGSVFLVAIGPALKFAGTIMKVVGWVMRFVGSIKAAGAAAGALSGPVGWIITAIVALGIALVTAYNKSEAFREGVHNAFNAVKEVITNVLTAVTSFIQEKLAFIQEFWAENSEQIKQITDAVWNGIKSIIEFIMPIIEGILKVAWFIIKELVISVWEAIKSVIDGALNIILGIVKVFTSLFTGDWSGLWDGVKQLATGAVQLLWGVINLWFVGKILKVGKVFAQSFRGVFTTLWNALKSLFTSSVNIVRNVTSAGFNAVRSVVTGIMNGIQAVIRTVWNVIKSVFTGSVSGVRSTVSSGFKAMVNAIRSSMTSALNAVKNIFTSMKNVGKGAAKAFVSIGKDLIKGMINGIKNMTGAAIDAITGVVGGVVNKAKSALKIKSPSRVLMEIGKWTSIGLAEGIEDYAYLVDKASDMLAESAIPDIRNIDLSYATPGGIKTSLASAVSGTVDVKTRDEALIHAIYALERRLTNLEVVMDGREVGRIVEPYVTEEQERNQSVRNRFRG